MFTGANIATILLLWFCCLVTYLNPASFPKLSLLTLLFPAFLLMNVAFVVFWLIFKVKRVWLPLVGTLVCYSFIRDYCPINPGFMQHVPDTASTKTLKILSYNTLSFGDNNEMGKEGSQALIDFITTSDADIICLQESWGGTVKLSDVNSRMEKRGYKRHTQKSLALYTRLSILKAETIDFPGSQEMGFCAWLLDSQDTILLINSHLKSNRLTKSVKENYRDVIGSDVKNVYESNMRDTLRQKLSPLVRMLAEAAPVRAQQVDTLQRIINDWLPRPLILCGDFNDTPVSYTLRELTKNLQSAYRESGTGWGFTFHERGFPIRIDHILFTPEHWYSYQTTVNRTVSASDHFPIMTHLARK